VTKTSRLDNRLRDCVRIDPHQIPLGHAPPHGGVHLLRPSPVVGTAGGSERLHELLGPLVREASQAVITRLHIGLGLLAIIVVLMIIFFARVICIRIA
jgi:hypothetical protein